MVGFNLWIMTGIITSTAYSTSIATEFRKGHAEATEVIWEQPAVEQAADAAKLSAAGLLANNAVPAAATTAASNSAAPAASSAAVPAAEVTVFLIWFVALTQAAWLGWTFAPFVTRAFGDSHD